MRLHARIACFVAVAAITAGCQSIAGLDDLHVRKGGGTGGAGGKGSGGAGGGGMGGVDAAVPGGSGGQGGMMDARVPEGGAGGGGGDMDATVSNPNDAQTGSGGGPGGCKSNELSCDGTCVPNDTRNCGKCGHDCTGLANVAGAVSCTRGVCVIPASACAMGHGHCTSDPDDGCETDLTLAAHCGDCDTSCGVATPLCVAPSSGDPSAMPHCVSDCPSDAPEKCGQTCVDTMSNPSHCGKCDLPCDGTDHGQAVCNGGQCAIDCNTDYHACPGDLCLDDKSGLSCGTMCAPCPAPSGGAPICDNGACDFTCTGSTHRCGDACSSNNSIDSCGSSCSACASRTHATTGCDGTSCTYSCNSPYVPNGNTCVCSVCAPGDAQCSGGSLQTCTNLSGGCGTFGTAQSCNLHACYDGAHCVGLASTQFGSGTAATAARLAVDAGGRVALAGNANTSPFDGQTVSGTGDGFLSTFPASFSPRTTKLIGTSVLDLASAVAFDETNGRFVVVGITQGALESGSSAEANGDVFVESWDLSGTPTRAWGKQFGTGAAESGVLVTVDDNANIFVAGLTKGSFPSATLSGTDDVFLAKLRGSDGAVQWIYQWVQSSAASVAVITCSAAGDVFLGGAIAHDAGGTTANDAMLSKWSPSTAGSLTWVKQWGDASASDDVAGIAFDSSGRVFAAGSTAATGDFDGNAALGNFDLFISRFDAQGNNRTTQRWGTSSAEHSGGIAVDKNGNIYVVGWVGAAFPGFTKTGLNDVFVTRWQSDLSRDWTVQWGVASRAPLINTIAVDGSGNIFVASAMTDLINSNFIFVSKLTPASGL